MLRRSRLNLESLESRECPAVGTLDPTFAAGGIFRFGAGADAGRAHFSDVALQADGKIVAAGHFRRDGVPNYELVLARLTSNGRLDPTFDGDGWKTFDVVAGRDDFASQLVILPGGQYVVSGRSGFFSHDAGDGFVLRVNTDGSLDNSFGTNGKFTDLTHNINNLIVTPGGGLLAPGLTQVNGQSKFGVLRLTADGHLDPSFGTGGRLVVETGRSGFAETALVQPNGKILILGNAGLNDGNADLVVARVDTNGQLDPTFDGDGFRVMNFSRRDFPGSMVLLPDGRIVVSALINRWDTDAKLGLFRLNANGSTDRTFGGGGFVVTGAVTSAPGGAGHDGFSIYRQSDGKLLTAGYFSTNDTFRTTNASGSFIGRLNANGTPDLTFGNRGYVRPSAGNQGLFYNTFAQMADGKVAAIGFENRNGNISLAVSRYLTGARPLGSIGGTVFVDANGNRARDDGELGMANVLVFADLNRDGRLQANEPAAFTNVFGNYALTGLGAATYQIRIVRPAGHTLTSPALGYFNVRLLAGQNLLGRSFALHPVV